MRSALSRVDGEDLGSAAITAVHHAELYQPRESPRMVIMTLGRLTNFAFPAHPMGGQGLHNTVCGTWNNPRRVHVVNAQTQDATVGSRVQ
jgi:hypothetical protein